MEHLIFAGAIVFIITLVMIKGLLDDKKAQKKVINKLRTQYGAPVDREYKADELERSIAMYYKKHVQEHQIDDITWNDLNMDELYRRMNYSHSMAGDEYLYYRLRTPVRSEEELEEFEERVLFFARHEKERVKLQHSLIRLGRMSKYSLYEYLDYLDTLGKRSSLKYYISILLIVASVILMFYSVSTGVVALLIVLSRNMINYYKEQKEVEPYITSFRYISRLLEAASVIAAQPIDIISGEREELKAAYDSMGSFRHGSFIVFSGLAAGGVSLSSNPLDIILDYIRMIFYLDLIKFNRMLETVRGHIAEIDKIVTVIGKIETAISVGEYREFLKGEYCIPEFVDRKEQTQEADLVQNKAQTGEKSFSHILEAKQIYHPLLNEPVKNDIKVSRGVLLTGSNASGKSTFLRAVAINAILAQTVHTCAASYYKADMFLVYSSMSLKDDLMSGDSYYMAEVKSIRRILNEVKEAGKNKEQVLCFVDEVLRGTNTVERIAASTQILKALARNNSLCFAATHDLELTKLLEDIYDNYHFEEEMAKDDIHFPYKIEKGPAVSKNAIALLKMLGYDKDIVNNAETMAERFTKSGQWI